MQNTSLEKTVLWESLGLRVSFLSHETYYFLRYNI